MSTAAWIALALVADFLIAMAIGRYIGKRGQPR